MALVLNDRVRETTSVVGTGAVNLLGYVGGYQAFSVIGNGNTCYYGISDQVGLNWEAGIGTYSSSGNTLVRTTVLKSSNSNNLVSFTAGTKDVFVTYPAETAVSGGGGGTYPTVQPTLNLDFANSKTVDPRITFVRNSTAAYYDGQTTALAEQNLLLQSQTFATTWVTSNATLGSLTTAPDGTTTAYSLTASAINGTLLQTFTATATAYTFSIYIQRVTGTGNIDITVDGTTYATQTTSGTWTRFTITTTPAAGSKTAGIRLAVSGDVVNIWGAQLEQRSSVTAYTPTTTAAITNYIPVLMTAPAGVPRLDYNPTTSQALGLLIEESRTNLFTYSSDFSNAVWNKPNATITSAANVAPDGTQTAQKLVENTVNAQHYVVQSPTCTGSTAYSLTIYAKAAERAFISMQINESGGAVIASKVIIDLSTGAVGTITALAGGGLASATATTTLIGNGWYRCKISWVTNSASTLAGIYISTASDATTNTYTGDGYSGIYIWGAQLEAGAFATSYIPTVATTITRAADQASMTGTNFSSWYNTAESTIYAECIAPYLAPGIGPVVTNFANSSLAGAVYMYPASNQAHISSRGSGGSVGVAMDVLPLSIGVSNKLVGTFKAVGGSTLAASICSNGRAVGTNTTLPGNVLTGIDRVYFGFQTYSGNSSQTLWIKKVAYYPVALSSSNLVALTS